MIKKKSLRRFSDDNFTISQIFDIKNLKSGVFFLNTIRLINLADADTCTNNIPIHNCT